MDRKKASDFDQRLLDLYDDYAHGRIDRRGFMKLAVKFTAAGLTAEALLASLTPNYAWATQVAQDDARLHTEYLDYESPNGGGKMRGYLARPAEPEGKLPAVLVIHENRGLNPYIEDVTRRLGVVGFLAFAPDALTPLGGYPGNDDDGKAMQASLDPQKLFTDMLNSGRFLKSHALSSGKLGATGFCYGGGVVNQLAVSLGKDLDAGVPFYGRAPATGDVAAITGSLMIQYAEDDPRVNAMREEYEAALKAGGKDYTMYSYPGTKHGFHNYSTPRYNPEQQKIAWDRTVEFFTEKLA
ncbi:MAG: dienelactone hydrolase family protein [Gammaproteobacteria bacterium]|nr:dienelactone hydrolase family protein [Gammaproteobacteria bacterium]